MNGTDELAVEVTDPAERLDGALLEQRHQLLDPPVPPLACPSSVGGGRSE